MVQQTQESIVEHVAPGVPSTANGPVIRLNRSRDVVGKVGDFSSDRVSRSWTSMPARPARTVADDQVDVRTRRTSGLSAGWSSRPKQVSRQTDPGRRSAGAGPVAHPRAGRTQ